MKEREFKERWSELHGDADVIGVIDGWLSFSYQVARACTALRISPNVLTTLGLATAITMAFADYAIIALLLLVLSLFFDGIDGSVAIVQRRDSKLGGLYDSIADRIAEAFWLYVGYLIGIDLWVVLAMWTIATVQEYARARLASLGATRIGVVTPTERPVRAIFMAAALIFFIFDIPGLQPMSYAFLALLGISFVMVMRSAYKTLK
jgi:phosphatidylglycerophosphate synthase